MSDPLTSIVILPALSKVAGCEQSLPAVAGEPKDLYLPRLLRPPARWLASRCIVGPSFSCDIRTRACALPYSPRQGTASASYASRCLRPGSRAVQQEYHENFLSRAQNGASQVDGESSLGDQSRLSLDTSARVCVSVAIHELEEDP